MKFEQPKDPNVLKLGFLLSRTWKAPYTNGLTDIWRNRAREYWERIEKRFGLILSEHKTDWAVVDDVGPVVSTYATVRVVMPGERFKLPEGERLEQ